MFTHFIFFSIEADDLNLEDDHDTRTVRPKALHRQSFQFSSDEYREGSKLQSFVLDHLRTYPGEPLQVMKNTISAVAPNAFVPRIIFFKFMFFYASSSLSRAYCSPS